MTTYDYDSLVNKIDVISQDAYRMGRIENVRYDPNDHTITGLVVKCEKEVSNMIGGGSSKSRILIKPENFELNDVLLLNDTVEDAKAYITADNENAPSVEGFEGMTVITSEFKKLGIIKSVYLDLDGWFVDSFEVKVDKEAHAPLGLKKLLGSKTIKGIKADHISNLGADNSIILSLTLEEVKEIMLVDE